MKRYIVGLGEMLWDVLPNGKTLGGATANFAYYAGQYGLESIAISAVGDDELGDKTMKALEEKRLKHLMTRVSYPTGTVQVTLDDDGMPTYNIKENVAWDNIPFTREVKAVAENCRAVCFGSLAQRNRASRETIQAFIAASPADCLRIFDINLRQHFYTKEVIIESMKCCNVLKINDEELFELGRMFSYPSLSMSDKCRLMLSDYDLDMIVLTCGADGSHVFTQHEENHLPTPKVTVTDTVGAGDAFTGCFCAALLSKMSVTEAHKLAVEMSAYVCTQNGAMPMIPQSYRDKIR